MTRALKMRRTTVDPAARTEYLAVLQALAARAAVHGRRVWVFQSERTPTAFVEFIESSRGRVSEWSTEESALLDRLGRLATYAPDSDDIWVEVPASHMVGDRPAG